MTLWNDYSPNQRRGSPHGLFEEAPSTPPPWYVFNPQNTGMNIRYVSHRLGATWYRLNFKAFGFMCKDLEPMDPWTERFSSFKRGDSSAVDGAIRLVEGFDWRSLGVDAVFPGIPSGFNYSPQDHHVCRTAAALAAKCGCPLEREQIRRVKTESVHKSTTGAEERTEFVRDMFDGRVTPCRPGAKFIIFDDVITRGTQMGSMADLILATNPAAQIIGLALAKIERMSFIQEHSELKKDNSSISAQNARLWDGA